MTAHEIDQYLANVGEPKRSTLEALRQSIAAVMPVDTPLPIQLVRRLIEARRTEAGV